jgi:hypothetical protein
VSVIASRAITPPVEAFRLQARLVPLRAGLHSIRYELPKDATDLPVILIQAMPACSEDVKLLAHGNAAATSLDAPGDEIMVRARRDARLVATIASAGRFGPQSVLLRIERRAELPTDHVEPRPRMATVELIEAV